MIKKDKSRFMAAGFFYIIVDIILVMSVLGQIFLKNDSSQKAAPAFYEGQWTAVYEDGYREVIHTPAKLSVPSGQDIIIETILPEDVENHTYLCFRASHESVHVYLDDDEIWQFDTDGEFLLGNNTASRYIFIEMHEEYANRKLSIKLNSNSFYSGTINDFLYGESTMIWTSIIMKNIAGLLASVILIIAGMAIVIICFVMGKITKRMNSMIYMGWATFFVGLWMLYESKLRQIIFPNSSIIANLAFLCTILISFSVMLLMQEIQKNRYKTIYQIGYIVLAGYFFIATILHLTKVMDLLQTMNFTYVVDILSTGVVIFSMLKDIRINKIGEYIHVAIGLLFLVGFAVTEFALGLSEYTNLTGISICIGMLIFVFFCAYNAIVNYRKAELEAAQTKLAMEMKDQFLANMSHELRTPINSVLGMNEIIIRECPEEQILEYSYDIRRAGQMLLGLVNDILDFSKIESGKFQLIDDNYSVANMLREEYLMLVDKAQEKGLKFEFDVSGELPERVRGDEVRVKQIITNLLSNAIKYTQEGTVTLKAERYDESPEDTKLIISVSDTGQGIRKENLDKLFESFTRLEEKTNKGIEGTGLGLSITSGLIHQMNGEIKVDSEYGFGSTFTVSIPQRLVDRTPIGRWSAESNSALYASENGTDNENFEGKTILVVDDNVMNLKVVKGLLKNTGLTIDTAEGGEEAVQMVKMIDYDLIYMDHMMPEMDGVETFHILEGYWDTMGIDHVPTIALTANAISGMKEKYINEGFNDYLSKPFKRADLIKTLKKFL